ncbi:MAG TPA: PAS domain S-box protein [Dissulfurispiraceae bacterium]|nr:PAS domain S-box protein [Dissulfurispiraceae bacterium]
MKKNHENDSCIPCDDHGFNEFDYRGFFENAVEGLFRSTASGKFIAVNPALAMILGYDNPEDLISTLQDLKSQLYADPSDRERLLTTLAEKGVMTDFETQFICKDGSTKWINLAAREVRGPEGKLQYIEGLNIDITARKNAEIALRESEQKFRRTFDQAPIGAAIMDINFAFIRVNKVLCDITGYAEEELLSRRILDIIHPDDVPIGLNYANRLLNGEIDSYENDRRFLHKNGGIIWVIISMRCLRDQSGKPHYLLPMIQDITSRKSALDTLAATKERLEHSESIYRAIVEDQIEQVCRYRSDGTITFVNDAYANFFQKKKEDLIGTAFKLNIPEDDLREFESLLRRLTTSKPVTEMEHRVILPDGQMRWLHRSVRLFFDQNGVITEFQVVGRDVTDRVVAEQEIKRISDEKEQYRLNLEAVFSSIPDAVLTVDRDMRIIHINKAMENICCISHKLVPGRSIKDFSGSCDRSCFHILFKTVQTKEPVIEYRLECATSEPRKVFIINSSPLRDQENQFMGAVLAIRDITRLANLERQITDPAGYKNIIGKSKAMQEVYRVLDLLTDVETTVLITGESGTGKELTAEALHYGGPRAKRPLVKVNCAALAENLLESELFGHVRGAFTGAVKDKIGRFEAAEGGTLFLDEIGDVPLSTQLKLLRVLERKEYERVGDSRTLKADVRVVTATNVDLQKKIRQGLFREDLYYRLKVMGIHLPPLREREQDIPLLCQHFINKLNIDYEKNVTRVSDEVMMLFMNYDWPGNVRELRHTLEHAFILCPGGEIVPQHLPRDFAGPHYERRDDVKHKRKVSLDAIMDSLARNGGNKAKTARQLGIDRRTLYRNLEKK